MTKNDQCLSESKNFSTNSLEKTDNNAESAPKRQIFKFKLKYTKKKEKLENKN
jgi:hypothetical protein